MGRIRGNRGNCNVSSKEESSNVQVAPSPPSSPPPPTSSPATNQDAGTTESKPDVAAIQDEVHAERAAKLKKYEADYAQCLGAKYFSQKGFDGEDIFDKERVIGEEIIKSGRFSCTKSFIDPIENPKGENASPSSAAGTSNTPGKDATTKEEATKAAGSNERVN